ncbi:MAG: hypothetical protein IK104_12115 [Clostridia bacterium]|nr:hypothetical protein [Clostridia bacterium]
MRERNKKLHIRILFVFLAFALVCAGFVLTVFLRQKAAAQAEKTAPVNDRVYNITVPADRGEILDRSGNTIVYNEQINTLSLNALDFPSDVKEGNEIILSLIKYLESRGETWIDNLPMTLSGGKPAFAEDRESDVNWMKSSYFLDLNPYATAQNVYDAMAETFALQDLSPTDAIKVMSVRYNMSRLGFSPTVPYTFAVGPSIQSVAYIKENGAFYRGVEAGVTSSRKYIGDGKLAAHLIGIVGAISADEYNAENAKTQAAIAEAGDDEEKLLEIRSSAYALSDRIGKNGIEKAMEPYLRGQNGVKTVTVHADGTKDEEYTVMPRTGGVAILTIDNPMQELAASSLKTRIIEETYDKAILGGLPLAGAVVVENVKTGEILAAASFPDFSLSTYYEDYAELSKDTGNPLWNRAFQSGYSPGSTMKPATAIAGLEEGVISPESYVLCTGVYEFIDQTFVCFNKTAHGAVNVQYALAYSCNVFFFEVANRVGIQRLNSWAKLLGLGERTGVEINETAGILAGYDERASRGEGWKSGETLLAAIGQSDNAFSPLQLTNYCATIANGGTRYVPYLVSKVLSSDYSQILYERTPQIAVQTDISAETLDAVKEGMYLVANVTSCREQLGHLKYDVACKTGTAEKVRIIDGRRVEGTDGFLIAFGPYDDPEIAITVVVENAGSGSSTAQVAADIFNYYFGTLNSIQTINPENVLR